MEHDSLQTYLEKYDMKPMSCRISNGSALSAIEDIGLNLSVREKKSAEAHLES